MEVAKIIAYSISNYKYGMQVKPHFTSRNISVATVIAEATTQTKSSNKKVKHTSRQTYEQASRQTDK